ncbi:MAG: CpsD/CapB family tyrosine-protein kinase [Alphaproteobacteria bacterium]|nr:CpsD/CapB family tyrosine-protein kinase [Alphaproteobacteria bacterium]
MAMEQISRALQKAKLERGWTTTGRGFAQSVRDLKAPRDATLSYTQTKIVPVSRAALRRNRIVAGHRDSEVAETFRLLRAQVLRRMAKLGVSTLGITSVSNGEGKTFVAANLALAIALDVNQTVLLVDADMRSPGIAPAFGIENDRGLSDYLKNEAELSECLINPGLERLVMLPTVNPTEQSAELLTSPRMAALAHELKVRYPDRVIIYDLPPLLTSGDTLGFLPQIEATLLVMREGAVKSAELRRAAHLLDDHHLLGTVLNGMA